MTEQLVHNDGVLDLMNQAGTKNEIAASFTKANFSQ